MSKNELPNCPGCGKIMELVCERQEGDRPWEGPSYSVNFKCKCGWKSPTRRADSMGQAFIKAIEAASVRAGKE